MQINNHSPWAAQLAPAWGKDRKQQMTVIVKTGFCWDTQGKLTPIEQNDIAFEGAERFFDDDYENASLAASNDLVPFKDGFELLVTGTAHPANKQAKKMQLAVAFTRGSDENLKTDWEKQLTVFGRRHWQRTLLGTVPSIPPAIEPTPVRYEYAYGGKKTDKDGNEKLKKGLYLQNPSGLGFSAGKTEHRLPLIEREPLITHPSQQVKPAGFGPIANSWEPRKSLFAELDNKAAANARCPYPASLNTKLYNSAPEDQQFTTPPADGTCLVLSGWHPDIALQRIELPTTGPSVMVFRQAQWQAMPMAWDTLIIDADNQRLYQLWRGAIPFDPAHIELMQFHLTDPTHQQWLNKQAATKEHA
ncbi:MAG: DUF2169 domain-containing protein [Reinekea sp.]